MNKIISFFRNKWTKRGISLLSAGYGIFMAWLAWLVVSFYLVPTNAASLFSLYMFVNVMFSIIMIYTRKQIITQIAALFLHPCIVVMLFFAFGNWFLLIPPFVAATIVFFASGCSETLKIILGTIYLILFVMATIGYLLMDRFSISIDGINTELRSDDYLYSTDETYRLVLYIDEERKENRTVSYYIERTDEDIKLPFLRCEKTSGSVRVLTARYEKNVEVRWLSDTKLLIDNKVKDISIINEPAADDDDDFSGETIILTTAPSVTKATTTEANSSDVSDNPE